jgi:hypothetical protein
MLVCDDDVHDELDEAVVNRGLRLIRPIDLSIISSCWLCW